MFKSNVVLAVPGPPRTVSFHIDNNDLFTSFHSSFQQAVYRNLNEKNAQLQKQLENVVREGSHAKQLLQCHAHS